MRFLITAALGLALVCGVQAAEPPKPLEIPASGPNPTQIVVDTLWSGEVDVAGSVEVVAGATLTIAAGSKIRFASKAYLGVRGRLLVQGTAEKPVEFIPLDPSSGGWLGLHFAQANQNEIRYARFRGGEVEVYESNLVIADSSLEGSEKGFSFFNGGQSKMERCRVSGVKNTGITVSRSTRLEVVDSRVERCNTVGIDLNQHAASRITGTTVSDCPVGLGISGASGILANNVFERNKTGMILLQAGSEIRVLNNRISDCDTGISCRQYASPVISGNQIQRAKEGISCNFGSNPEIINNLLADNERAIVCVQLCNPTIEKNVISGNKTGIYLHLSSYAVIHDNNFAKNALHVELDNMSADWENRARAKTVRGLQARNQSMVERGKAMPDGSQDVNLGHASVDATGNWWGPETTREMEIKGPDADISTLKDYYDVPKRTYEGFEGEYIQDKIRYAGWRTAPVPDAGPVSPASQTEAPKGTPSKQP